MNNLPFKRNAIVTEKEGEGWLPYGRVIRFINDEYVEVIDTIKNITTYHIDELIVVDYKGYWESSDIQGSLRERFPIYHRMPSMRKLKQIASGYHPLIWKRNRKKAAKEQNI